MVGLPTREIQSLAVGENKLTLTSRHLSPVISDSPAVSHSPAIRCCRLTSSMRLARSHGESIRPTKREVAREM